MMSSMGRSSPMTSSAWYMQAFSHLRHPMHWTSRSTTCLPSAILWTPTGHAATHAPQSTQLARLNMTSCPRSWLSGFEHHLQRRGQPLRKAMERTPGPSYMLYF